MDISTGENFSLLEYMKIIVEHPSNYIMVCRSVEVSIEINQTEDIIEQDEITIKDEKVS